jgi:outer membrane protein OmpA-like peptidoglycan-associated protein
MFSVVVCAAMPEKQKNVWVSSAVAAAIAAIVIISGSAYVLINWGMPKAESFLNEKFAALDAKIAKNNENALAAIKKSPLLEGTTKEIETLNSKIKKTNETLTEIQKQISTATLKTELAPLDAKLDKATSTLAAIQADLSRTKSDDAARNSALTRVEKAINAVKDEIAGSASQAKLQDAATKLDAVRTSLAKLETTVKGGFAGGTSSRAELKAAIAQLAQPPTPASTGGLAKAGEDLLVFYVSLPAASPPAPPQPGAIPPMTVQFEKIGNVDDKGQADLIIRKLRPIIKEHKGCSIAVSGHTDTLGSDEANHALSKRRAQKIAAMLKSVFAGDHVQITNTAWGERRLKEWTKDDVADATNRRVDIVVRCTGE